MADLSPEKSTVYKKVGIDLAVFAKELNADLSTVSYYGQLSTDEKIRRRYSVYGF
jgi:hypothetical protein